MKKFLMIASAAAMAVTMPGLASADKGGQGQGKGNGGGNAAAHAGGKGQGGGGKQAGQGGQGRGHAMKAAQPHKGNVAKAQHAQPQKAVKQAQKAQKQHTKAVQRSAKAQNKAVERQIKAQNKQVQRVQQARLNDDRYDNRIVRNANLAANGAACPPGLAKKNNGCLPPGQAKKLARGQQFQPSYYPRYNVPQDYRSLYYDNPNLRNANLAANGAACPPGLAKKNNGCLPPGQAKKLARGQQFQPSYYPRYNVPQDYRSLYYDNPNYYYRYDDNGYIYRVDRSSDLVSGLIPLLGGGFGVGQPLPAGYDLYNVPLQYRDTYYDTNDAYYRYGDNAIYQVDPQTQMIQTVAALLTGDSFGVGQTMPAGYDMYNVPLQYRDQYYDTDQYNYRYADNYIYQIDPQTQIIQSIISALI